MKLTVLSSDAMPSQPKMAVIERSFPILCEELGIAHYPNEVTLKFNSIMEQGVLAGGATNCACVDPVEMELRGGSRPFNRIMQAFVHEMIHVRQLVTGDLRIIDGGDIESTFVCWKGERIPAKTVLRWKDRNDIERDQAEAEAYGRMDELYDKLMARLPSDDAEMVGARPLWAPPPKKTVLGSLRDLLSDKLSPKPKSEILDALKWGDISEKFKSLSKSGLELGALAAKCGENRSESLLLAIAVAHGAIRAVGEMTRPGLDDDGIDDAMLLGALFVVNATRHKDGSTVIAFGPPSFLAAMEQFEKITGRKPDSWMIANLAKAAREKGHDTTFDGIDWPHPKQG